MSTVKSKTKKAEIEAKGTQNEETQKEMPKTVKKGPTSLELAVYNQEGQEVEKISLPQEIFGLKINQDLVKQAVEAQMSQARIPYAHTKDRSEVRGGGKKPWRQKGTGRARHGSIRSPLWRGGGVTFGPRKEKDFSKKINKKMKRQALLMVLSGKARDNEIILLDDLKLEQPKTKLMAKIIGNLEAKIKKDFKKGTLIALFTKDENIIRATRNIPKISTIGVNSLNVVDLLSYKYLLMLKGAIEVIKKIHRSKGNAKI